MPNIILTPKIRLQMEKNLSVILIAHNEEQNIGTMIEGLFKNYNKEILELIVVDDCSTDRTAFIAQSWSERTSKVKIVKRTLPCGVGRALKAGFSSINPKADYVLSMDCDFTENIKDVALLIREIEEKGLDGVIGSRFIKGGKLFNYPFSKKIMNRLFHFIVKRLFGIKQNDLTNNFKLYKRYIFQNLPWESNGFALNAETGILPVILGYRIGEVPISWFARNSTMGKSKFRLYKAGWSYVWVIIHIWQHLHSKSASKPRYFTPISIL
jgi:dolichol-phosphate mannosyltransferase